MPPVLVLIAGPTCGGKSTLAEALRAAMPPGDCQLVALDWYYRNLSNLAPAARAVANFDHPDAFDWELLRNDFDALLAGKNVLAPAYDFATHVRARRGNAISCAPVIMLEGIFALYDDGLNARAALRVFVDAPDDVCLSRRIARDVVARGRTEVSVREQFSTTVQPMAERYVRPTARRADLTLDGRAPIETLVHEVLAALPTLRAPS